ncbi:MAG: M48 family metallopeptidase [Gammaproteobacteria bacterium]|nr:M48 family metallopeptidase [Gammaproteobacteria bacterium]
MNFFEQQARTRRQTLVLVLAFVAAVIVIALATNIPVLAGLYFLAQDRYHFQPFGAWLAQYPRLPLWTSLAVVVLITVTSLYRILSLARGGGAVARLLGGTRIDPGTRDPARRQLVNVIEEVAIAAGLPVPEIYVLETEGGINAFAAGFTRADAAIAVTRGALDSFTRDELQGVIAHEFSHILNGDTRLNMRLIGASFGILAIALAGRALLQAGARARDARGSSLAFIIGGLLFLIGGIGVIATRFIKAAVSRQREWLADASAVQFTRNPLGIAGALKKIAVSPLRAAILAAQGEEVSHMLIAEPEGFLARMFASHPPILERIRKIDPHFRPSELENIKLAPMRHIAPIEAELAPQTASEVMGLAPHQIIARIGTLGALALRTAAALDKNIAVSLKDAAHSADDCVLLVLALVLHEEAHYRDAQLAHIAARNPALPLDRLRMLHTQLERADITQRMPLLEMAFPALRQRPALDLRALIGLVDELARLDGNTSVFEYSLSRHLRQLVLESLAPRTTVRSIKLYAARTEIQTLFSLLAETGHADPASARRAYEAGVGKLPAYGTPPPFAPPTPWVEPLDRALLTLDRLEPMMKQELVSALVAIIQHDRQITLAESELLRVICACLHCPMPPLHADAA